MSLFPLPLLSALAQHNPALARALEIALYSGAVYLLTALTQGDIISSQALIVALCTPLLAYFSKLTRDIGKDMSN